MNSHFYIVALFDGEEWKCVLYFIVSYFEKVASPSSFRAWRLSDRRWKPVICVVPLRDSGKSFPSVEPTRSIIHVPRASMLTLLPVIAVPQWAVVGIAP